MRLQLGLSFEGTMWQELVLEGSASMTVLKIVGLVISVALFAAAAFLAHAPWRVHGGRFATEYLVLAGAIALVALVALAITLHWA